MRVLTYRSLALLIALFALAACTKASPAPAKAPADAAPVVPADAALVAPVTTATASVPADATVILVDTGIIPAADAAAAAPVVK